MDEPPEHELAIRDHDSSLEDQVVVSTANTTTDTINNYNQQLASLNLLNTELLDPECEACWRLWSHVWAVW